VHIGVVGTGYVGLVVGACLAENGNFVACVDNDAAKSTGCGGEIPIYEPGLNEWSRATSRRRGCASRPTSTRRCERARSSSSRWDAAGRGRLRRPDPRPRRGRAIGRAMNGYKVIVNKSTVPVGTRRRCASRLLLTKHPFAVVSNPEFLKEGTAVDDFLKPDRCDRDHGARVERSCASSTSPSCAPASPSW